MSACLGAAPLALFCMDKVTVKDFNSKHKNVYKYKVVGGLHTCLAKSQLAQEIPDNNMYKIVNAEVYVGLTDESLRLAQT